MGSFDTWHDRKNTRSVKWDMLKNVFNTDDVIPMWVADMDFQAPQAVNDALIERAQHGFYGYTVIDGDVKKAVSQWLQKRHNWSIDPKWLSFSPGVVTSLHIAIQAFTKPDDKVLIQTPVYTPFYNVIEQHGREIVKNPLKFKDYYYSIDFDDFEDKLKQGVKAFILCSPHNPVGRVWTKEELLEMARLCLAYNVLILSDDIHADLVYQGYQHIPIASLSEEIAQQTITCMSPTKTFNLAGLQASYIVTKNDQMRRTIDEELKKQGVNSLNTMGNIALEAAYTKSESWLDELLTVLEDHKNYVTEMFQTHTEELTVVKTEGTYLLWIDCSRLQLDAESLQTFMIEQAKVGLNPGVAYGKEGEQFMRMNIACPKPMLEKAVDQIITAVRKR